MAAFLSEVFSRSPLSAAILFLAAGLGLAATGTVDFAPDEEVVVLVVESTLFIVLFTDAMHIGVNDLRDAWGLPGRALLVGMPLVFGITVALGGLLLEATWVQVMLIAAVLAPTDPVLVGAITSREPVPSRLRYMLTVESGVNDGLALPVVLLLIAVLSREGTDPAVALGEVGLGALIGVAVPALVLMLKRIEWTSAIGTYGQLLGIAIGIVVFSLAKWTGGNEFLAAFAAGVTIRSLDQEFAELFDRLGDVLSEILKLFGLLLFASVVDLPHLAAMSWTVWLFAALALLLARPASMAIALATSPLGRAERLTVGWFGPKGFASVFLALLVLQSGIPDASYIFGVITLVIGLSIVVHSSTDVAVARYFGRQAKEEEREAEDEESRTGSSAENVITRWFSK